MATSKQPRSQCPDCHRWFVNLDNHKVCKSRSSQSTKPKTLEKDREQCPDCNKYFVNLDNHKVCKSRSSQGTKPKTVEKDKEQCPDCHKYVVNRANHKLCESRYSQSTKPKTIEKDKEQCPECHKYFVNLDNHKVCKSRSSQGTKPKTTEKDKEQCPDCNKYFVNLDNHKVCESRSSQSTKPKTIEKDKEQCPECHKYFVNLDNHKLCESRYSQSTKPKTIEKDKEQCPECHKYFVNLDNHKVCESRSSQTTKPNTTEKDKEQCPECHKYFVNLDNHKVCESRYPHSTIRKTIEKEKQQSTKLKTSSVFASSRRSDFDTEPLDDLVEQMVTENIIQYSANPDEDVKDFFDNEVKMTQSDIQDVQTPLRVIRDKVLGQLNVNTDLGGWELNNCGSHADGTKVSRPDEMDCILFPKLTTKLVAEFDDCQPGFCRVRVEGDMKEQDLKYFCDGKYLNSKKYRHYVFKKLEYVIEHSRKYEDIRKFEETVSFAIRYTGIPTEDEGMKSFDVDFVPSLSMQPWPDTSEARDILSTLKDADMAKRIKDRGYNLTPKSFKSDLQWQISFSFAEKELTKFGDKLCWKPVMRTIKRVVEIAQGKGDFKPKKKSPKLEQIKRASEFLKQHGGLKLREHRFTTYHIRTFMWTLRYELTTGDDVWKEDSKARRLKFTLGKLQKMLTGEMVVPHFFIPKVKDILRGVSENERKFLYMIARATDILFSKRK